MSPAIPKVPTSVMAETAADPLPTAPRDARCAASPQKATPRTDVIPVVAISDTTVLMSERCLLSRIRDNMVLVGLVVVGLVLVDTVLVYIVAGHECIHSAKIVRSTRRPSRNGCRLEVP